MEKLIVYYSYSGNSKKIAVDLAKKDGAEILEITDIEKPSKLKAYVAGCFSALRMKPSKINTLAKNLSDYESIVLVSPVWAGHTTPQINAVLYQLPANKKVEMILVSGSGQSSAKDKIKTLLISKNCELTKYEDIKA